MSEHNTVVLSMNFYIIESKQSERSEYTVVTSLIFVCMYIYSVYKKSRVIPLLRRIMENHARGKAKAAII